MTDLTQFAVDLETQRPNPSDPTKVLKGDSPRTAFQKHNDMLDALGSAIRHVGAIAPSPTQPYMVWLDTGVNPPIEYQRNAGNTAWVLKTTPLGLTIRGTLANTGALPNDAKTGDTYIIGGNLYAWSGTAWVNLGGIVGPQGPQGVAGTNGTNGTNGKDGTSFRVLGMLSSIAQFPPNPKIGDSYNVAGEMWTWNGTAWQDIGPFRGPQGIQGIQGVEGLTAYQVAVVNGFTGSQAEWLESLRGPPGISLDVAVNDDVYSGVTLIKLVGEGLTGELVDGVLTISMPYAVPVKVTQTYNNGDYFGSNDYAKGD